MGRARGDCRNPGRRDLGGYRFHHQQSAPAFAGEDHGRRCPVPAIPWQGRLQCSRSVYLDSGALLCGNRLCDYEFLVTKKTQGDAEQGGASKPSSCTARRDTTPASCGCTGSSYGGFGANTGNCASPSAGGTVNVGTAAFRAVTRAVLVATRNGAPKADGNSAAS